VISQAGFTAIDDLAHGFGKLDELLLDRGRA